MQEAKQALELMGKWETIDVCDALELLSPVFESEEVIYPYFIPFHFLFEQLDLSLDYTKSGVYPA